MGSQWRSALLGCLLLTSAACAHTFAEDAEVTSIDPRAGSLNGGTRVTIKGKGFAKNQFNFGAGQEHLGNEVYLISGTQKIKCDVHKDGCTEIQLMCYTRSMPEDDYQVRVYVDGREVSAADTCKRNSNWCRFQAKSQHTPRISEFSPDAVTGGLPGQTAEFRAKTFTNLFGTNEEEASNGRGSVRATRFWFNAAKCNVLAEEDKYYRWEMDRGGQSDWGHLSCLNEGTYVGNQNVSFLIDQYFGRSLPDSSVMYITGHNEPAMTQTYAKISGISPRGGSTEGQTTLTISGQFFDETDSPIEVRAAGVPCIPVGSIEDGEIVCKTGAQPETITDYYTGNRGLEWEIWNDTDIFNMIKEDLFNATYLTETPSDVQYTGPFSFREESSGGQDKFIARARGYFTPPTDNLYSFSITCDDVGMLLFSDSEDPADRQLIAECPEHTSYNYGEFPEQKSELLTLKAGRRYYIEGLLLEWYGHAHLKVAVQMYNTAFTAEQAGNVRNEKQEITTTSSVVLEKQGIKLNDWKTKSSVNEVQQLKVTSSGADPGQATFRLGLDGVYTSVLSLESSQSNFRSALNLLPSIAPDSVTVTSEDVEDVKVLQVTINSERGDFNNFVIRQEGSVSVSMEVKEVTKGQPSGNNWVIGYDGLLSEKLSTTISADNLEREIEEMLGARCPTTLLRPAGRAFLEDYEAENDYRLGGTRVIDREAFCGRTSNMNSQWLFLKGDEEPSIDVASSKFLCFGYAGKLQQKLYLKYTGREVGSEASREYTETHVLENNPMPETTDRWGYTCIDMWALIKVRHTSMTQAILKQITVWREDNNDDYWLDTVYIGRFKVTEDGQGMASYQRLVPDPWILSDVEVSKGEDDDYNVTLTTLNCDNNLPLFNIGHASAGTGTSDRKDYTYGDGLSDVSVTVTRYDAASPAVRGTFNLEYGQEQITGISASVEEEDLSEQLSGLAGAGIVSVKRTGTCAGYSWTAEFQTSGGDKPQLIVDQSEITGRDVVMSNNVIDDGGVFYDPVPADLTSTYHMVSQVTVAVNGIPSICDGDCSFSYQTEATPTVTGINPTQGSKSAGTVLTITGTGFTSSVDLEVTIGGVACDVTSSSDTEIQCSIGEGPAGSHLVEVVPQDKGLASGSFMFTYQFAIASISPAAGSTEGGTVIDVTGTGFGPNLTVTLGGTDCPVSASSYTTITCTTSSGSGSVAVVVTEGTNTDTYNSYTFTSPSAVVTSVSTTAGLVDGSQSSVISGRNFGAMAPAADAVTIGGVACNITAWSDSSISALLPALPPGSYPLHVMPSAEGFADLTTNSITEIEYKLKITSASPAYGSLQGGTKVTLTGEGLSTTPDNNKVTLGDTVCNVISSTDTEAVCVLDNPATTHVVSNQGRHPKYGVGYAWSEMTLEISLGDFVRWQWMTPELVTGVSYSIIQVDGPNSRDPTTDGFTSGNIPTSNGAYTYQFNRAGTFHYWSGFVDSNGAISLRGKVKVSDRPSFADALHFQVGEIEAQYENSGASFSTSSSCAEISDPISGCSGSPPTDGSVTFSYGFWDCSTPTITSISPTEGTTNTDITITGSGFGSVDCQNVITVGGHPCTVTSSSTESVVCRINAVEGAEIGRLHDVAMTVHNRGAAVNTVQSDRGRRFSLKPLVTGVSPSQGSTEGGTLVTLTGSGFSAAANLTVVGMGTAACEVQSVTYTEITCMTSRPLAAGSVDVQVAVGVNGGALVAVCDGTCKFDFISAQTPTVTSFTPTTISAASTVITFTGTGLGSNTADISVSIGDTICVVQSGTDTEVTCDAGTPLAGSQTISFRKDNFGYAKLTTSSIIVTPTITSVTPSSGSTAGGTEVVISGLGFSTDDTTVTVGGSTCTIQSVTRTSVTCRTPGGITDTRAGLVVVSNANTYTSQEYMYDSSLTPTVSSVSPGSGNSQGTLTITGTGLGTSTSDVTVSIDGAVCSVTSAAETSLTCTLGAHSAGTYDVSVRVSPQGSAAGNAQFTYEIAVDSASPVSGSFGGDQLIQVSGRGFDETGTTLTVCGESCVIEGTPTATSLSCRTPRHPGSGTQQCEVVASVGGATNSLNNGFMYDDSVTPVISSISPTRGGTGGGTTVTITGYGYGTVKADVEITIAGTDCIIATISDTEITCATEARKPSVKGKVRVEVNNNGIAGQDNADFEYVDLWSSVWTWGGGPLPVAGDFVVIPADMTMVLDMDTPILQMILIQGGKLIFDQGQNVALNAVNVLIVDGGVLQVGTEAEPFTGKAIITMHGHPRSKEMPIYGTKGLFVREGTLDLHGQPVGITWSRLASTAAAGANTITLVDTVNWQVGDEIAIATTGHRHSQIENEKRNITAISGRTLTLDSPLEYEHLGITVPLSGGQTMEARAEVGLLTHNVVVRGSDNPEWHDKIEACEKGFDTGEFVTQTCFQGRFGEETGADQFGAQILLHAPEPDKGLVTGRISSVEFTYVGQAFRLGRYATHFHLNGDMSGSYVRGCGYHLSFNRAVNIHGTHNVMVEHNVLYNIMGGAFFLEDGVETGNTFQYNLAIFVKSSTSLQNDDITPAAFWITNPNNTVRHNAAAGGTHFGYWYRMHEHPDGPSFDANIWPRKVPLLEFRNNSAHSQGWFGIWIFQQYTPMVGGSGNVPIQASFEGLTAWHCEKGAETVGTGSIQFKDFILVDNDKAGHEGKLILEGKNTPYSDQGPVFKGGIVAANVPGYLDQQASSSAKAIILPYGRGLSVKDMNFMNFNSGKRCVFGWTKVDGKTEDNNGGFYYETSGLSFTDSPNKACWRWEHEAILVDLDGTLTGIVGGKAVPVAGTNPPQCTQNAEFSVGLPGDICEASVKMHRYSWNDPYPRSLLYKNVTFKNRFGSTKALWKDKRLTHGNGWMVTLLDSEETTMTWDDAEQLTNITYLGRVYDFNSPSEHVMIKHEFMQSPDWFTVTPVRRNMSARPLAVADSYSGDWTFNEDLKSFKFILSNRDADHPSGLSSPTDRGVQLRVYRCLYSDCIPPPDPDTQPPPDTRPDDALLWSDKETWKHAEDGWGGNYGGGDYGPPRDNKDIMIKEESWVVVDAALPVMNKLYVYGTLELEWQPDANGNYRDFTLNCSHIFINGGRLIVGWEKNPFQGNAKIVLRGDHSSPDMPLPGGPNIGAKAIGNFGGLDLHGVSKAESWVHLQETAPAGSSSLSLPKSADWTVGDQILISTTGYDSAETEIKTITAIDNSGRYQVLTIDSALQHTHIVVSERVDNTEYEMRAKVAVLTRTVQVIGDEYPQQQQQAFGARILVGSYVFGTKLFTGWARISNVEFDRTGQEGWTDFYDPRYSLAFLDVGDVTDIKPSYVRNCAFHHGFSPAVGVYGTNALTVEDNVIHQTIGSSMLIWGERNVIKNNLVTRVLYPGTWNGRSEDQIFEYQAGIELQDGAGHDVTGNVIAGSERAGIRTNGQSCDVIQEGKLWENNEVHSCLIGLMVLGDGIKPCSVLNGFKTWKNWYYGTYIQSEANFVVQNHLSVDNQVGLYPQIYKPAGLSHQAEPKYVQITDSLFVGISNDFNCEDKRDKSTDRSLQYADTSKSWDTSEAPNSLGGKIGISFPTFSSDFNAAPKKDFNGITSYQAIMGEMRISGVTFANFGDSCSGNRDYALSTSAKNEDAQHPISLERIASFNVNENNKVFNHRPDVSKVNPADCVDMDCDAKKKALLEDKDGSFLGFVGAIFSESEFEWGGDPRRGLGDYRIPKTMLSTIDGARIQAEDLCPNKGIVRRSGCELRENYHAWVCRDSKYKMLMLESLDDDTETRRVSPVAVLADGVGGGYIDLINGPQDHGWCMGYTCQKRLSTFPTVLATGQNYTIHYSGTAPQDSRMYLLNAEDDDGVIMSVWYAQPWRLDVYVNGMYVMPNNCELNSAGQLICRSEETQGEYMPQIDSDHTGSNYFHRETQILNVLVKGSTPVTIITNDLVFVSVEVPFMTVDEFFGERIVENLAAFFNIPKERIRIAEAVRENARRRRRETDTMSFKIEITNSPSSSFNTTAPGDLSPEQFQNISATLTNMYQLDTDTLQEYLNVTLVSLKVTESAPPSGSEQWRNIATVVSDSQKDAVDRFQPPSLQVPTLMHIATQLEALHEGSAFTTQPALGFKGHDGETVGQLGSVMEPWVVEAKLVALGAASDDRAYLMGETIASFTGAAATFSNLAISHSGNYAINFTILSPAEADFFSVVTASVIIPVRSLSGRIPEQQESLVTSQNSLVMMELMDAVTEERIPDVAWKGHEWTCTLRETRSPGYTGPVSGFSSVSIDPGTGFANFTNLIFPSSGRAALLFKCLSAPAEYDLTFTDIVTIYDAGYVMPEAEVTKVIQLRFTGDYSSVAFGEELYIEAAVYNYLWTKYSNITIGDFNITEGSVVVAFTLSGKMTTMDSTLNGIWEDLKGPLEIDFGGSETLVAMNEMYVDGEPFYGVDGAPTSLSPGVLAGIGVACGLVLIALVALVLFFNIKAKKNKQGSLDKFDKEKNWSGTTVVTPPTKTEMPVTPRDVKFWGSQRSHVILGQAPPAKIGNASPRPDSGGNRVAPAP